MGNLIPFIPDTCSNSMGCRILLSILLFGLLSVLIYSTFKLPQKFQKVRKVLIPILLWVTFIAFLEFSEHILNYKFFEAYYEELEKRIPFISLIISIVTLPYLFFHTLKIFKRE